MAYPTIDAPYGFVPVKRLDGMPWASAMRTYRIASGYATTIHKGDLVKLVTGGTIERETADAAVVTIGVFMGCEYTDPNTNQLLHSNKYPAGIAASDIVARVIDDPNVLYKLAVVSSGTTIGDMAITDIGANGTLVDNTGDSLSGVSRVALSDTSATTNTLPVRIVDVVTDTINSSGGYPEVLVKFNAGHQFANLTGV